MQRFCSIFSQLLQLFPRLEFEQVYNYVKSDSVNQITEIP